MSLQILSQCLQSDMNMFIFIRRRDKGLSLICGLIKESRRRPLDNNSFLINDDGVLVLSFPSSCGEPGPDRTSVFSHEDTSWSSNRHV